MARKHIFGYIVEGPSGSYQMIDRTLWLGGGATVFKTLKRAKAALKRTKTYAADHGYTWEWVYKSYPCRVYKEA